MPRALVFCFRGDLRSGHICLLSVPLWEGRLGVLLLLHASI